MVAVLSLGVTAELPAASSTYEPIQIPLEKPVTENSKSPPPRTVSPSIDTHRQSDNPYELLPQLLDEALTGTHSARRRSGSAAGGDHGDEMLRSMRRGAIGGGDVGVLVDLLSSLVGQLDVNPQTSPATRRPDYLAIGSLGAWVLGIKALTGAALVLTGLLMMIWNLVAWRGQRKDATFDEFDRRYYGVRFRRRMQTAAFLGVLGVMLPLGDQFVSWGSGAILCSAYSGVVWVLSIWILVLAAANRLSTNQYVRSALARLRRRQHELEKKLECLADRPAASQAPADGS